MPKERHPATAGGAIAIVSAFTPREHTAATLLLGRGVHPKIVSEMLGHSTIAITLDLYSHVTPTMQREAAAVLDAVLGGGA